MHIDVGGEWDVVTFSWCFISFRLGGWDGFCCIVPYYCSEDLTMNCLLHFEKALLLRRMILAEC